MMTVCIVLLQALTSLWAQMATSTGGLPRCGHLCHGGPRPALPLDNPPLEGPQRCRYINTTVWLFTRAMYCPSFTAREGLLADTLCGLLV